jgi:hypothetical protein
VPAVYDDQKQDSKDLNALTGISKAEEAQMDDSARSGAAEDKAASSNKLGEAENAVNGGALAAAGSISNLSKKAAGFFNPAGDETKGIKSFVAGKLPGKKASSAGVGVGGLLAILFILFFSGSSLILVHIEKIMQGYEAKVEQKFEKDAARQIISRIIKKQIAKAQARAAGQPDPDAAEAADAATNGEVLTEDADSFNFEAFKGELANQGIKAEFDSEGNLTSLTDEAGNDLSNSLSPADFDELESAMPEWAVGQLDSYRPLMVDQYDVSFEGMPDTDADNVKETEEADVSKGATNEDLIDAAKDSSSPAEQTPGSDPAGTAPTVGESGDLTQESSNASSLGKAIDATNQELAKTGDSKAAIAAGEKAFGADDPANDLLIASAATTACNLQKAVKDASDARIPTLISLLVRHWNLLLTVGAQVQTGHIKGSEVNQLAQQVEGNPAAPPTANKKVPAEDALPFNDSEVWAEATGGNVGKDPTKSGYTPGVSPSVLPNKNGAQKIDDEINGAIDDVPGAKLSCKALTSSWGVLIQGALGVTQLITDIGSISSAQVGITTALIAFQVVLQKVILPDILKFFTVAGVSGTENAVDYINDSGVGGNIAFNDYSRRLGARPMTDAETTTVVYQANQRMLQEQQEQPWVSRTFALSNPYSLASRVAIELPLGSIQNLSTDIRAYFVHAPFAALHSIASIISSKSALADPNPDVNSYGLFQYGFPGGEDTQYDPIANEQFLYKQLTITANDGKNITFKPIDILGNPATYTDSMGGDPTLSDWLHCFTNSTTQLDVENTMSPPPNPFGTLYYVPCASIGQVDQVDNPTLNANNILYVDDKSMGDIFCQDLFAGDDGNEPGFHYIVVKGVRSVVVDDPDKCGKALAPNLDNEIQRFRQYILDVHVINDYKSLEPASGT